MPTFQKEPERSRRENEKGQNKLLERPVSEEVFPEDEEIEFQKPVAFTGIWHNKNDFEVAFTKDHTKAKRCKACKVEFARGGVACMPHDIAVLHMDRYLYHIKDAIGKLLCMEATWKRETE